MGLYYNPNIHPLREYLRRKEAALQVAENLGIKLITQDSEYHPQTFIRLTAFREEQRCFLCYQLRLERTRSIAFKGGFDYFTTTLLFSKRQKHELIRSAGSSLGGGKTAFLYEDFRTRWNLGKAAAESMGIYRQNYCGCIYSEFDRFKKELNSQ